MGGAMDDLKDFSKPGALAQNELFRQVLTIMIREDINQSDLAKRLQISTAAVAKMFKGSQSVTLERAEKVARAVGMTLHVYLTPRIDDGAEP
jgi:plasmid maintenance system antidote protein VapI